MNSPYRRPRSPRIDDAGQASMLSRHLAYVTIGKCRSGQSPVKPGRLVHCLLSKILCESV